VIELLDDEAVVEDIEGTDVFKEKIFTSLLLIDKLMETLKVANPIHTNPGHSHVKLPKLQLRPFLVTLPSGQASGNLSSLQFILMNNCLI